MAKISIIELEKFEDMILFLHSRMTAVSMTSSLLCSEKNCFTIISASDEQIFIISSPPPETKCRYAHVDENGKIKCTEIPPIGKPIVFIITVKSIREADSIVSAIT
ncbi:hypothetical protein Igag_0109 [Ignisphaera aggregans DSM 17230]|uniref:Uncharacterized protein n=1 Tax=Ignisphaera aggregans (strain DSM 17230 / JCM 13409 / AQ1.S1) TaxID=583356 RepID=E0SPT9_IGNAA|nr:hypothetical protein Igag_0109 [Ignisphaera aggregans DSM 17230]